MNPPQPESGALATLTFEQALERLEEIVRTLEGGDASLEQSIALYTEGTRLRQHCDSKLKDAQLRIEKLQIGPEGAPTGTEELKAASE